MGKSKQPAVVKNIVDCMCCKGSGSVVVLGVCPLCDGVGQFDCDTPKLSNKAAKARAHDISQCLSTLLRHTAREKGVAIDAQGWVLMDDALKFINEVDDDDPWEGGPVTLDEIRAIVASSDKQRFAIWDRRPPMIRASQGHTMKDIQPDLEPLNVADVAFAVHGTYYKAWDSIKSTGLSCMDRNHIHLARDLPGDSGVISGMRASCEVLIWVDLVKADAAGLKFMKSNNGVILSEGRNDTIGPEFFNKVVDRQSNASLL